MRNYLTPISTVDKQTFFFHCSRVQSCEPRFLLVSSGWPPWWWPWNNPDGLCYDSIGWSKAGWGTLLWSRCEYGGNFKHIYVYIFLKFFLALKWKKILFSQSIIHKVENTLRKALVMRGRRPYTVAIASYALTLLGTDRFKPTQELLAAASPGNLMFNPCWGIISFLVGRNVLKEAHFLFSLFTRSHTLAGRIQHLVYIGGHWLRITGTDETEADAGSSNSLWMAQQAAEERWWLWVHSGTSRGHTCYILLQIWCFGLASIACSVQKTSELGHNIMDQWSWIQFSHSSWNSFWMSIIWG